jgi:hypothetical protein
MIEGVLFTIITFLIVFAGFYAIYRTIIYPWGNNDYGSVGILLIIVILCLCLLGLNFKTFYPAEMEAYQLQNEAKRIVAEEKRQQRIEIENRQKQEDEKRAKELIEIWKRNKK